MDAYVALRIGRIRRALYREFEARVGAFCLTVPQYQMLNRLWDGDGILTSTLVADTSSDGATVTGIVDRLEARGLIRRERGRIDRRRVFLFLTPEGRALEGPVRSILLDLNEQALRGLDQEDREQLLTLLTRVEENLDQNLEVNLDQTDCRAEQAAETARAEEDCAATQERQITMGEAQ